MSRNRCDTECSCGFWKFQDVRTLPIDDGLLMTEDEYLRAIDWVDCPYRNNLGLGWSEHRYREREDFYMYDSPEGNCSTTSPRPGWKPRLIARYEPVPHSLRFRFRKLECPICRRLYAGWYVRQPHVIEPTPEPPVYELSDTSFYYAFNDEPSDRDEENVIRWTPEEIVGALRAWRNTK